MQTSNVKSTLSKMRAWGSRFSKIRAVLSTSGVSGINGSESEDKLENNAPYTVATECRMAQLHAEAQRARAEGMAHEIRRKLI